MADNKKNLLQDMCSKIDEHTYKINNLENTTDFGKFNARVEKLETDSANLTQTVADNKAEIENTVAQNKAEQTAKNVEIDDKNTEQDDRLDALDTDNTSNKERLTAIENTYVTKNTEQSIGGKKIFVENSLHSDTLQGRLDTTSVKVQGGLNGGASIELKGKSNVGSVVLIATNGTDTSTLTLLPDGALKLGDFDISKLNTNTIAWHNTFVREKYLGSSITTAQNTAIANRTYDDIFIGDYWEIGGVKYRVAEVDTYYRVGDTEFTKGNIVVVPDTCLYDAQMNTNNTTSGAYTNSAMRTSNLAQAYTTVRAAFGSHLANHRILIANATDNDGPSGWAWIDSGGIELMNETQVYGTRTWSSRLKAFDNGTQHHQLALFGRDPQRINTRQTYWLQDISSDWVSSHFAYVSTNGSAYTAGASDSLSVRPAITLTSI